MVASKTAPQRLWIGGSSGLTWTFMNSHGCPSSSSATKQAEDWILLGHEPTAPPWLPSTAQYYQLNLVQPVNSNFIIQQLSNIKQVVIGIRPPLITSLTHPQNEVYSDILVAGLDSFLTVLMKHSRKIQSVATSHFVRRGDQLLASPAHGIQGGRSQDGFHRLGRPVRWITSNALVKKPLTQLL